MSSAPRLILPSGVRRIPAPRWQDPRLLPPWVDLNHSEAKRGTGILRKFDPVLVACFDPMAGIDHATGRRVHGGCFTVWGLSQTVGRVPILLIENPDGSPQHAPVNWDWWVGKLVEMRDGPPACDRAHAANQTMKQAEDQKREAEVTERFDLTAEGMARNRAEDPQDVLDGVELQITGQKPAPKGRKTFL